VERSGFRVCSRYCDLKGTWGVVVLVCVADIVICILLSVVVVGFVADIVI
jgi:hypothetical protein